MESNSSYMDKTIFFRETLNQSWDIRLLDSYYNNNTTLVGRCVCVCVCGGGGGGVIAGLRAVNREEQHRIRAFTDSGLLREEEGFQELYVSIERKSE